MVGGALKAAIRLCVSAHVAIELCDQVYPLVHGQLCQRRLRNSPRPRNPEKSTAISGYSSEKQPRKGSRDTPARRKSNALKTIWGLWFSGRMSICRSPSFS